MKKIFFIIVWVLLNLHLKVFAQDVPSNFDWWILGWVWDNKQTQFDKIRKWEIHMDDIPLILKWAIDYLMWFAWTIAIIFIILWAYKIALWSLDNDKSKWKEMVVLAISWLVLASLAWVILKVIIDNFS